jgi:hypothetical protein
MTVGVFLPYVPLGTSQSRPRSGTNGLQEAGLQGRICSFLLSFIYSDALSLYRLRFSVELISHRPPLGPETTIFLIMPCTNCNLPTRWHVEAPASLEFWACQLEPATLTEDTSE